MTFPPPSLTSLAAEIASILKARKETIAIVETACGGLISSTLLSVPGASAYYKGGVTLYTLESRIAFGGWTEDDLKTYDGPTPTICERLASHLRLTLPTPPTYILAESGTAGPTPSGVSSLAPKKNRQPGYCAMAIVGPGGQVLRSVDFETGGVERSGNMVGFAEGCLRELRAVLE
ncbi:hypothetical protein SAICODRAFT_61499 [Saitoella complicata NRRL Y-17804]|nr:uncharacterized protein SAICODRAFT_61499 [Saitoella complicata NRRL Y-17804]ODQ50621.1 hypothetical protein SAICODRAFT_61499 [Saitoella complicata NRRL Y-17804]